MKNWNSYFLEYSQILKKSYYTNFSPRCEKNRKNRISFFQKVGYIEITISFFLKMLVSSECFREFFEYDEFQFSYSFIDFNFMELNFGWSISENGNFNNYWLWKEYPNTTSTSSTYIIFRYFFCEVPILAINQFNSFFISKCVWNWEWRYIWINDAFFS